MSSRLIPVVPETLFHRMGRKMSVIPKGETYAEGTWPCGVTRLMSEEFGMTVIAHAPDTVSVCVSSLMDSTVRSL